MHIISIRSFLENLKRSNLLSDSQFAAARTATAEYQDSINLGAWLIKQGWLTRWQVQQILAGKTKLHLGKYKLLEVLGQGGMGGVLKAEQSALGRTVALKVMVKELVNDHDALLRFQREMRSAAALNHPNIVSAIDADCVGDQHFLVMEYVEGKDLKAWIKEIGRLPIDWSCECVRQAALGLQHAHEEGLVHRDIKPANLLVSNNEETGQPLVKILDLGLARLESDARTDGGITQTGQIMGSPDYIAPEQAQNAKDADIRADIFSLGVTLYQMLTGRLPYDGNNIMEKLISRATRDAAPASTLRADIPAALDGIVGKMLARQPSERFQTPGEVAAVLTAFRQGKTRPAADAPIAAVTTDAATAGTLQPFADATLNDFIQHLSDGVGDSTPSYSRSSYSRVQSRPVNKVWLKPAGIAIIAVCVVAGLLALWNSTDEKEQVENKPQKKASGDSQKTTDAPNPTKRDRVDDNPHRSLARMAVSFGTNITLQLGQDRVSISQAENLPTRPFEVVAIDLHGFPNFGTSQLKLLSDVNSLQTISFSGSGLSDENLTRLNGLSKLDSLDLGGTLVSDVGLPQLAKLDKLTILNLRFTSVSDVGLRALSPLIRLTELNLEGTDITDAAIAELKKLENLKSLFLSYTFLSKSAVNELALALPGCHIKYE